MLATPCPSISTCEPLPKLLDLLTPREVSLQRVPASENVLQDLNPATNTRVLSPLHSPPCDVYPNNVIITSLTTRSSSIPKLPPNRRITRQHTANQHALAYTALNLARDGSLLPYLKAKAGPESALWPQAIAEEFVRLFFSQTMQPMHSHDQPANRHGDTTHFIWPDTVP